MNKSLKAEILAVSNERDLARFLAAVVQELTIAARSAYAEVTPSSIAFERLRVTNELIHKLSGQMRALLDATPVENRYPDKVFLEIVEEIAQQGCAADLERAFRVALERQAANPLKA